MILYLVTNQNVSNKGHHPQSLINIRESPRMATAAILEVPGVVLVSQARQALVPRVFKVAHMVMVISTITVAMLDLLWALTGTRLPHTVGGA